MIKNIYNLVIIAHFKVQFGEKWRMFAVIFASKTRYL